MHVTIKTPDGTRKHYFGISDFQITSDDSVILFMWHGTEECKQPGHVLAASNETNCGIQVLKEEIEAAAHKDNAEIIVNGNRKNSNTLKAAHAVANRDEDLADSITIKNNAIAPAQPTQ
jgi:hypothetical protein